MSSLIMQTELALSELPQENNVFGSLEEMLKSEVRAKNLIREFAVRTLSLLPKPEIFDNRERVMLVDSQIQFCQFEVKVLQRLGYDVTSFTDNTSALEVFRENPKQFDLVIIDCSISSSGLNLAQELKWLAPDVPIIMVIGPGESEKISRAKQMSHTECVEKPILTRKLEKIIQRLLERRTISMIRKTT